MRMRMVVIHIGKREWQRGVVRVSRSSQGRTAFAVGILDFRETGFSLLDFLADGGVRVVVIFVLSWVHVVVFGLQN